jgi:hypothetical protein
MVMIYYMRIVYQQEGVPSRGPPQRNQTRRVTTGPDRELAMENPGAVEMTEGCRRALERTGRPLEDTPDGIVAPAAFSRPLVASTARPSSAATASTVPRDAYRSGAVAVRAHAAGNPA